MMLLISSFSPLILLEARSNLPLYAPMNLRNHQTRRGATTFWSSRTGWEQQKWLTAISSSGDDLTVVVDESSPSVSSSSCTIGSASEVVLKFYQGINLHDLAAVQGLIADNCVYEDLIFPHPFVGRKAILDFFQKFIDSISTDLQFVIDDISVEDSSGVGVTWHLEWKGKSFPFSKGCSFYRLAMVNGQRQIIYGRDSVEPAIKPGETALVAIQGVTWLLEKLPWLAERFQ